MAVRIREAFTKAETEERPVFLSYIAAGFPNSKATVDIMLSMEKAGVDVIELGIPFSDPIADGDVVQKAHHKALENGVDIDVCLGIVSEARSKGLIVPVIFVAYYNPILQYGERNLAEICHQVGVDGFIIFDLPPEQAKLFREVCTEFGLSYVPLVTPATSSSRVAALSSIADSFIYVVSRLDVTNPEAGIRDLSNLLSNIERYSGSPLAGEFGISTPEHFKKVGSITRGVIIGSEVVSVIMGAPPQQEAEAVYDYCYEVSGRKAGHVKRDQPLIRATRNVEEAPSAVQTDTSNQWFGDFGGQYVPEAVYEAISELETAYNAVKNDTAFWEEFRSYYPYINRPSQLHLANRLTEHCKGAQIYLKREDLNHTGAHKINNTLGQVLVAKRLGKTRIIAETGAGQHGVATATICAKMGMECVIYMGAEDCRRQALNVFRMRILGATVIPATSGSQTLKDAVNEAMKDWVMNIKTTHFLVGSAIGPHPYPAMVRDFQSVIGKEIKEQILKLTGNLPDALVACVGGGSNAIGMFYAFIEDKSVKLYGVEAEGSGIHTGNHAATITTGSIGVFQGCKTYLLQDKKGQIFETHSISAGLDYPGVGPEHSLLHITKRAEYSSVTDAQALQGFRLMSQLEGIIPALESSHAIYRAIELAKTMNPNQTLVINVSGRGDKDVNNVAELLPTLGPQIDWDLRFQTDITK